MNDPAKLYDRLTPDERLRLWVRASDRGDEPDADRLLESCPRFSYTCRDFAFNERIEGCVLIGTVVVGELIAARQVLESVLWGHGVMAIVADHLLDVAIRFFVDGKRDDRIITSGIDAIDAATGDLTKRIMAMDNGRVSEAATRVVSVLAALDGWARDTLDVSGRAVLAIGGRVDVLEGLDYDPATDGEVPGPFDPRAAAKAVAEAEPDPAIVDRWRSGFDALWAKQLARAGE